MSTNNHLLPLQEVISKILTSRQVSGMDFNLLSLALLSDILDDEEKNLVHRVFYALRRDWLILIDISDEQLKSIKSWLQTNVFC
ncbi:hypothetical protein PN499_14285 [Kamptonema animale CS-326]|jgi:hypothetical protein|uniref:hypothetical protein n=1 Tax=Kamptonema animale TaxID=92934 RepID=UPI00232AA5B7|nr:hypothetical protein [Kamptonema animale]MDB9512356.1 hypothetical protein [Kamptonema animale CS-326]